jgi:hypothetical protein
MDQSVASKVSCKQKTLPTVWMFATIISDPVVDFAMFPKPAFSVKELFTAVRGAGENIELGMVSKRM